MKRTFLRMNVLPLVLLPFMAIAEEDIDRGRHHYDKDKHHHGKQHSKYDEGYCHKGEEYDYIIVGLGTAGAPLARKLSDDCKHSVLVLEWGQNRNDDPNVLSPDASLSNVAVQELTYNPKYSINYTIPLNLFPGDQDVFIYSNGRMWGGSSAHNGLFAVRGTPPVYDSWAEKSGDSRWTYDNLLPLMKCMEDYHPDGTTANLEQRGINGPVDITQEPPVNNDPFMQATAAGTDTPFVADYNDPSEGNVGVSAHQQWITPPPKSKRSFSSEAYLPVCKVVTPDGRGLCGRKLIIESGALVNRVIFGDEKHGKHGKHDKHGCAKCYCPKAVGVEYISNLGKKSECRIAKARKKIILCAGTEQTAAILQRSGIGPKKLLEKLCIDVVVDNPNVGSHLVNHYGPIAIMTGDTPIRPFTQAFVDGFNPEAPEQGMDNDGIRRLQMVGVPLGNNAILVGGILLQSHSEGSVRIVSKDPTIYPDIELNEFSDGPVTKKGSDLFLAVDALKLIKNIAQEFGTEVLAPAPELYPAPYGPAPDDSLLEAYIRNLSSQLITFHNTGTARMAKSMCDGVVDGCLQVFGVKNLMVADCSIEPTIEDGNTGYSAYIIGLEAACILGCDYQEPCHSYDESYDSHNGQCDWGWGEAHDKCDSCYNPYYRNAVE